MSFVRTKENTRLRVLDCGCEVTEYRDRWRDGWFPSTTRECPTFRTITSVAVRLYLRGRISHDECLGYMERHRDRHLPIEEWTERWELRARRTLGTADEIYRGVYDVVLGEFPTYDCARAVDADYRDEYPYIWPVRTF